MSTLRNSLLDDNSDSASYSQLGDRSDEYQSSRVVSNFNDTGFSSDGAAPTTNSSTGGNGSSSTFTMPNGDEIMAKLKAHKNYVIGVGVLVLFIIFVAAIAAASSSSKTPQPWLNVRLPTNIVPVSYTIELSIDLPMESYTGISTINLKVVTATSIVLVHWEAAEGSGVDSVQVTGPDGVAISSTFSLYPTNDFVIVQLAQQLPVGEGSTIVLSFHNNLDTSLRGLYQSTYRNEANQQVRIATTQFEATDARKAFPCFDEPALKAQFSMIVQAPWSSPTILSNMRPETTSNITVKGQSWQRVEFEKTPKMSTYLLAIVVSDYASVCTPFQGGKQFCVYAAPDKIAAGQAQFAVDVGAKQSDAYDKFFGTPYPLPKQDMVAIADFAAGAMENWGLITYRETALLFDPNVQTDEQKQNIARVIAHELAHQWFGDIVTMNWWSDIWLNEGFASWVQYIGMNAVFSDWQSNQQFLTDTANAAYVTDGLPVPGTHSIVAPTAETPAQISSLFDSISYNKGACLIRMMDTFLSRTVFQKGLVEYLSVYKYSNAYSDELMTELYKASLAEAKLLPATVNSLMASYLNNPGYPLLTVKEIVNDDGSITFTVEQSHYLSPPNSPTDNAISWWVPMSWKILNFDGSYATEDSIQWIAPSFGGIVPLKATFRPGLQFWIKLNRDQGFYQRVLYPLNLYDRFSESLVIDNTAFTIEDRTGLMMDAFSFAWAGQLPWGKALNLTLYFSLNDGEQELTPITELLYELGRLAPYFQVLTADQELFNTYARSLLSSLVGQYYPPSRFDDHLTMMKLQRVWQAAAQFDVGPARKYIDDQFASMYKAQDPQYVQPPELISTVYNYGMSSNPGEGPFEWMKKLYDSSTSATASARYLAAMASVRDNKQLNQLLGWAIDGSIKSQDSATVLVSVANRDWALFDVWLRANFDRVAATYSSGYAGFGRVISAWVSPIQTQAQLDSVISFMTSPRQTQLRSALSSYQSALITAQANMQFVQQSLPAVRNWINWYNLNWNQGPSKK